MTNDNDKKITGNDIKIAKPQRRFRDGDVVSLTSGGQGMTVVGLTDLVTGREGNFFYDLMYFDGSQVLTRISGIPELSLKLLREKHIVIDPFEAGFEDVVLNSDAFNYAIDAASQAVRAGREEQEQLRDGIKAYLVAVGALSQ